MRIAAQVPGLDPKTLARSRRRHRRSKSLEKQVAGVSRRGFYARLPLTAARLLDRADAPRRRGRSLRRPRESRIRQSLGAIDFTILPDDALATTLQRRAQAARSVRRAHAVVRERVAREPRRSEDGSRAIACRWAPSASRRRSPRASAISRARIPGIALSQVAAIARHDEPARRALETGTFAASADLPDGPDAAGALRNFSRPTAIAPCARPSSRRRAGGRTQAILLACCAPPSRTLDPDAEGQLKNARANAPSASCRSLGEAALARGDVAGARAGRALAALRSPARANARLGDARARHASRDRARDRSPSAARRTRRSAPARVLLHLRRAHEARCRAGAPTSASSSHAPRRVRARRRRVPIRR